MKKRAAAAGLSKAAKKKRRWSRGFREDAPHEEAAALLRNGRPKKSKLAAPEPEPEPEVEQRFSDAEKKARALRKKLRDVDALKAAVADGVAVDAHQQAKLRAEAQLRRQLERVLAEVEREPPSANAREEEARRHEEALEEARQQEEAAAAEAARAAENAVRKKRELGGSLAERRARKQQEKRARVGASTT